MKTYFKSGCWNAICDRCGFQHKSDELKKEWNGLMVCNACWDPRHPMDFIKVPTDDPSTPWARPAPTPTFVSVTFKTIGSNGDVIP
jgi:hypothetical protein